jgi:hypothetical protein
MRKYQYTEKGFNFERVDKKTARTAYINGLSVVVCPVNLRPGAPWHPEAVINKRDRAHLVADEIGVKNDFNNWVGSFEFYNCPNTETGKYAAFYIPVKMVDRFTGETPTADTLGTVKQYDYKFMEV